MQVFSALDLKILSFLKESGIDPAVLEGLTSIQLVRLFEQESGCSILSLLEQEYWDEQVESDLRNGTFSLTHPAPRR
jgi:hypothetical protein